MTVRVLFWSYFRERTGVESIDLELADGSRVADVLDGVGVRFPALAALRGSTLVAVGLDYAGPDHRLAPGDEVSLFPPVQGG